MTAEESVPVSAMLESLAAYVAQQCPERLLSGLEQVSLVGRGAQRDASRMRVEQLSGDGSRLRLRMLTDAGPLITATAILGDARLSAPPRSGPGPARLHGANAALLYALDEERSQPTAPVRRVLSGVRQLRPASLDAELDYPGGAGAQAGHSGPLAIEGMLQLARWTWFAIAGDRSVPDGFERLTWFRLPRPGELLRLTARLKGTRAELPCLDVEARSGGGALLLQLQGVRLLPLAIGDRASRSPAHWQRFLSLVTREDRRAGHS